jgi:LysM repeat protein
MAVVMWNPGPGAFWTTTNRGETARRDVATAAPAFPSVRPRRRAAARRSVLRAITRAASTLTAEVAALTAQIVRPVRLPRLSKRRRLQIEAALVGIAVLAAVVLAGAGVLAGARALVNAVTFTASTAPAEITLPVRVAPGDSLWKLAGRYGDPDAYILDRVDDLARANGLSSSARLVPGQRLVVPVRNPVEVARLRQHVAMAR